MFRNILDEWVVGGGSWTAGGDHHSQHQYDQALHFSARPSPCWTARLSMSRGCDFHLFTGLTKRPRIGAKQRTAFIDILDLRTAPRTSRTTAFAENNEKNIAETCRDLYRILTCCYDFLVKEIRIRYRVSARIRTTTNARVELRARQMEKRARQMEEAMMRRRHRRMQMRRNAITRRMQTIHRKTRRRSDREKNTNTPLILW